MHTNHACNQESDKPEFFRTCGNEITGGSKPGLQLVEKLVCPHSNFLKNGYISFLRVTHNTFFPPLYPKFCIICFVFNFSHSYDSCKKKNWKLLMSGKESEL